MGEEAAAARLPVYARCSRCDSPLVAAPPGLAHSFRVADTGPARWLTIHAPDGGFAAFMRGLRDGVQVEWDIAPVPAKGGLPADHAIISRA